MVKREWLNGGGEDVVRHVLDTLLKQSPTDDAGGAGGAADAPPMNPPGIRPF